MRRSRRNRRRRRGRGSRPGATTTAAPATIAARAPPLPGSESLGRGRVRLVAAPRPWARWGRAAGRGCGVGAGVGSVAAACAGGCWAPPRGSRAPPRGGSRGRQGRRSARLRLRAAASASFDPGADLLDAQAHQRGDVLVALLALREQAQHRLLVVAERHSDGSLWERHARARGRGRELNSAPVHLGLPRWLTTARLHSHFDALVGTEWLDDDPDARPGPGRDARRAAPAVRADARRRHAPPWSRASARARPRCAVLDEGMVAMGQSISVNFMRPITEGARRGHAPAPATAAARPGSGRRRSATTRAHSAPWRR